jgi:hypothetical protein
MARLGPLTIKDVIEECVDIALVAPGTALKDGLDGWVSPPTRRLSFARKDHPAVCDWRIEACLPIRMSSLA